MPSPHKPVVVELDAAAAGRMGAQHLLETGSPHYAFFRRYPAEDSTQLRDAFIAELARAGHTAHKLDMPDSMADLKALTSIPRSLRVQWLADRLPSLPRPIAIMAEEDRFAVDLVVAAQRCGLRVPEDIAVLGSDADVLEHSVSPVALSSVDSGLGEIGHAASVILQGLMSGGTAPTGIVSIPPQRVEARRSTDHFTHADPGATAAILHIRRHFHEPIDAPELARLAGMSIRRLQDIIKKITGQTLTDELTRLRLQRAERLLRETDLKLSSIAYESGLGQDKNLIRHFQKKHQLTPSAWREKVRTK